MRLEGKVAFITGAGRGIGRSIGLALARDGAKIAVTGRTKERRDQVADEIIAAGGDARPFVLDVTKDEEVVEAVRQVLETWGKIDILVSNVAIRPHKPILEVSNEEWDMVMRTNLFPAFYLIKAVLPGMMERRIGSIIALGGQAAITGRPETISVTSAKHGLLGMLRAVAAEMAPYNIRANIVNPGSTDTERRNPEWYPEFQQVDRRPDPSLVALRQRGRLAQLVG